MKKNQDTATDFDLPEKPREASRKPYEAPRILMRETLESVAVGGCAKADLGTCGFGGPGGPVNS